MCGIFAYSGQGNSPNRVLEGLKRLEYRGYDSWGVAYVSNSKIKVHKQVGEIGDVNGISFPDVSISMGHTRWATHGGITKANAHPHFSTDSSFVLAQNGIVENYNELKEQLRTEGYVFKTQTDTEVIVRLIEKQMKKTKDLKEAVRKAFNKLEGRNTIIVLDKTGNIYAAKFGSPLVIGYTKNNDEIYFSSDTYSFSPWVEKITVLKNGDMVTYEGNKLSLFNVKNKKEQVIKKEDLNIKSQKVDKEGFDHFMLKEIYESDYVIQQVINQKRPSVEKLAKEIKREKNVYTIGSGTTGLAAAQMAFYLRKYAKVNAKSLIGAEAHEYVGLFSKGDLIITPSQSGETADVLEILELAKDRGVKIASYVNMLGSSMTRISDFRFLAAAGPEVCVMSTKVFVSQIAFGYLLAKTVQGEYTKGIRELKKTKEEISKYLADEKNIKEVEKLGKKLAKKDNIFILAKEQNLQIALEGMVKIIEGSYKHAHAIPAGDLKHFAITLMEKGVTVLILINNDDVKSDIINAANEVKARGATVIGVGSIKDSSMDYFIELSELGETSALLNIIPLQLLAYYMTVALGNNVDKPRNIAKSVTVK